MIARITRYILPCLAVALVGYGAPAEAATINFETTPLGIYSSLAVSDSGLTMTLTRTSGASFEIGSVGGRPASWGSNSLENFCCGFPIGDEYNADFSSALTSFSIQFGDFGPSDDDSPVVVSFFSGLGGVGFLGSVSTTWLGSDSFPGFKTLSFVSGVPVLSVQFTAGGPFPNSLFWDNITAQAVPEPATLLLLGSGLGLAAARRRMKKRA